jgi:two-component system phosphate regulon sensor histidine kinase PhoR
MNSSAKNEIQRLLLFLAVLAILGWIAGKPLLLVALGLSGYGLWSLYQLLRATQWLHKNRTADPPESLGLWGELFDSVYALVKSNQKERERLQNTINHLRGSFAALSDAVVMLDSEGGIEWCNGAAKTLLGLSFPEDEHQPLVNLLRAPEFIRYFDEENYTELLNLKSPVNPRIDLHVQITLFGKRNRLLFARDVTRFQQVEQIRKDFIANVSHELRTPLTVISGYLDTINSMVETLPKPLQKAVPQMLEQADRMEAIVKDLLLLTQLESVPVKSRQIAVDVCAMIERIRDNAQLIAPLMAQGNRRFHIDCQQKILLLADPDEIYSAFSNLVYNAVRYTPEGGDVWIRWWVDESGGNFSVRDNGIGIDRQHIPRLTERFYRVDASRSQQSGGTGLGLAIVKHVLLRHEANLLITSRVNEGSEFICRFPLNRISS